MGRIPYPAPGGRGGGSAAKKAFVYLKLASIFIFSLRKTVLWMDGSSGVCQNHKLWVLSHGLIKSIGRLAGPCFFFLDAKSYFLALIFFFSIKKKISR